MLLSIRPPAENTRGSAFAESVLRLLHRADTGRQGIVLSIRTNRGEVGLTAECPDELRPLFREAFLDRYPGTQISVEPVQKPFPGQVTWRREVRLSPDILPLRTDGFSDPVENRFMDPLGIVCSALRTGRSGRIECSVTLKLRPASERHRKTGKRILTASTNSFWTKQVRKNYLAAATHPSSWWRMAAVVLQFFSRRTTNEPAHSEKLEGPLFEAWLSIEVRAPADAGEIATRKLREITGAFGQFAMPDARIEAGSIRRGEYRPSGQGMLLTPMEAATIWHPLAIEEGSIARVERNHFREIEPPVNLPSAARERDVTTLGRVLFRNQRDQFGIRMDDLRRHLLIVGKTGCGKSTLLANIVAQQMEKGRGVILIDPHGQLVDDVLSMVPRRRTNDVILFDASDPLCRYGFNPLRGPPGSDATLVADGVLTAFMNLFHLDAGSAPRLLHILRNCLLSLIGRPDASLLAIQRLLVDAPFRKGVTAQVSNPVVREFWRAEFERWSERDRTEYVASLQNKLGAFLTNERLQKIFDPARKGIELRTIMDRSKILLCNLSRGLVGQDASTLLGSLLLSSLHIAAMSRADMREEDRVDSVVVVDEFHAYLAEGNAAMSDALAESRKYRTSYVLATQLLEQLDSQTLAGVLGNCGSTLAMTVGPRDAHVLAEALGKGLTPEDLMEAPKYHGYLRLLVEGVPQTLSMTTQGPLRPSGRQIDILRRGSRSPRSLLTKKQ